MAGLRNREPVVVQYAIAAVPVVAAFMLQVLDSGGVSTPAWVRAALTGLGAVIGTIGAVWARQQVDSPVTASAKSQGLVAQHWVAQGDTLGAPQNPKHEFPAGSVDTGTGPAEVATIRKRHSQ